MATPKGPENVPLKTVINDLQIVILIKDLKSNQIIRTEKINYGDREQRSWLGKVSYWAYNEGYSVETMSEVCYNELKKE